LKELRYVLGGPQGGGLETSSQVLSWAFAREGYGVVSDREYFSNIKGRHSYVHATVSAAELYPALDYPAHIVGAMDSETVFTHMYELAEGGSLIYNSDENAVKVTGIASMEDEFRKKLVKRFTDDGIDGSIASAVKFLSDRKVPMADALIGATARVPTTACVTDDPHFRAINGVRTKWVS
jgi:2-oxoglutarate ferredoxin oxidoreductase subunit alpha